MKKNIHPTYHTDAKVECSCGAVLEVGSTEKSMHTEICSQCHPFYTGKKNVVDTMGRVDRFKRLTKVADKKKADEAKRKQAKAAKAKTSKKKSSVKSETKEKSAKVEK